LVPVLFHGPKSDLVSVLPQPVAKSVGFRPVSSTDTNVSLLDPTPLFLPTEWNARPNALPLDAVREPGSSFANYQPSFTFHEDTAKLDFPVTVWVPEKPAESLDVGPSLVPFAGIGRTDREVAPLPGRIGFVQVSAEGNGYPILEENVTGALPPGDVNWQPLEFLAVISTAGLVSPPTLIGAGSGFEQVDAFFQNYLAKGLRIGERLGPGFYRIKIGP
jgi:hypothetical protein